MALFRKLSNARSKTEKVSITKSRGMRAAIETQRRRESPPHLGIEERQVRQAGQAASVQTAGVGNAGGASVILRARVRPAVLHVCSLVTRGSAKGKVRIIIIPTKFTRFNIGDFHRSNIQRGRFRGESKNIEQAEWVAATGMMDLYYGSGNVQYKFSQGSRMTKRPFRSGALTISANVESKGRQ